MQRPRIRFTVRQLLIIVAVASVIMGVTAGLLRRRAAFRQLAENYARKASQEYTLGMIATQVPWFAGVRASAEQIRMQDAHNDLGDHYAGLRDKYKRAADRPWLPVGADASPPIWPSGVPFEVPR